MTLIERLSEAEEGSREMDEIICAKFSVNSLEPFSMQVTRSIDAALALVERVLPGVEWEMSNLYHVAMCEIGLNFNEDRMRGLGRHEGCDIPLAICIALLKAMETQNETES